MSREAAHESAGRRSQHRGRERPDLIHQVVVQAREPHGQVIKVSHGTSLGETVEEHVRSPRALARGADGLERGDALGGALLRVEDDVEVGRGLLLRELLGFDRSDGNSHHPPVADDGDCPRGGGGFVALARVPLANPDGDLPRRGTGGGRPVGDEPRGLHEPPRELTRLVGVEDHRHLVLAEPPQLGRQRIGEVPVEEVAEEVPAGALRGTPSRLGVGAHEPRFDPHLRGHALLRRGEGVGVERRHVHVEQVQLSFAMDGSEDVEHHPVVLVGVVDGADEHGGVCGLDVVLHDPGSVGADADHAFVASLFREAFLRDEDEAPVYCVGYLAGRGLASGGRGLGAAHAAIASTGV